MNNPLKHSVTRLNQPLNPESRLWRYGLVMIVAVFVITAIVQSLTVPPFEGNDEQLHYAYVRYLANHLDLPPRLKSLELPQYLYRVSQEAGQPPLYYIPVTLLTSLAPGADDAAPYVTYNYFNVPYDDWLPTPYDAGPLHDNQNVYLHGAESQFPFTGLALALHLGRLVSIVIGAFTLLGVYGIGRALRPAQPAVALLATALVASVPGFLFIHSVITNDTAVILFVTLCIWVAVRIAREGPTPRLALLGGLFGGCATLSKVNGAWGVGIVCLALLAAGYIHRRRQPFKSTLLAITITAGVWLLLTGWWFAYGAIRFGDPLGNAGHEAYPGQTSSILSKLNQDFQLNLPAWDATTWYSSGQERIYGPEWIYLVFRALFLVGLLGCAGLCVGTLIGMRRAQQRPISTLAVPALQACCLLLAMFFAVIGCLYTQIVFGWIAGRYLYAGLMSAAVLAAVGWAWWLTLLRPWRLSPASYWGFALVVVVLTQGAAIWTTVNTAIALSPHMIWLPLPQDINRTQLTFVDPVDKHTPVAKVIGYRVHPNPQGLRAQDTLLVDICWKSTGYSGESLPYSLQLVGPNDMRLGTRNSYHGLGSYPLRNWKPGEEFCDPTSLHIDFTADKPRAYNLVVTLFPLDIEHWTNGPFGSPLPAIDAGGRSVYPQVGRVRVAPNLREQPVLTPAVSFRSVAGLAGTQIQIMPDQTLSVTLHWLALDSPAPAVNAKIFMHVIDPATNTVIAQDDHEPDAGWFPTSYWLKGDRIDDHFDITLPSGARPDQLKFVVGMYEAQSQARLPAINLATGERLKDDLAPVTP